MPADPATAQFDNVARYEALVADPRFIVPDELAVIDVMCFGPPLKPSYKRWKKRLDQIMSWERFNPEHSMTDAQIDRWVKTTRHKVMYKDESKIG